MLRVTELMAFYPQLDTTCNFLMAVYFFFKSYCSLFASLQKKYNKIVERLREPNARKDKSPCNGSASAVADKDTSLNDTLDETDQARSILLFTARLLV